VRRLRTIPGRETYLAELDGRRVVVKRTSGDVPRELWYERLRGRRARSPGRREFENLRALAFAGFDVPRPLCWARDEDGRSLVAMEHVPHEEDLAQRLARADRSQRREWIARLARLVARLHGAGFYHRDLYLTHVVLRTDEPLLVLLDAGRVRRERAPRRRWFAKDLAALLHSRPAEVSDAECLRFLIAYRRALPGRSGSGERSARRAELRSLARRVRDKARRLASHRPRFADAATHRPPSPAERGSEG